MQSIATSGNSSKAAIWPNYAAWYGVIFPHTEPSTSRAPSIADLAKEWSQRLEIPIWYGAPFGHHPDPLSLAIGRRMRLQLMP